MNYILFLKSFGYESLRMTQDKMQEEVILLAKRSTGEWQFRQKNSPWRHFEHSVNQVLSDNSSKVINWGNCIFSNDGYFDMNRPSSIHLASNKKLGRRILQNAGVEVPFTVFPSANIAGSLAGLTYPVIARPSHHHGGQNFHKLDNFEALLAFLWGKNADDWYVSNLFQKTNEYRFHVGHNRILFVNEKPLVAGEIRANQAVNHQSWRVLKWSEYSTGILANASRVAIRAMDALGLEYGAVDLMVNANDGSCAVCEVNTSPSINTPYSSEKYAQYFDWVIRHHFPAVYPVTHPRFIFYSEDLRD